MDFILLIMIFNGKYLTYLEKKCWQGSKKGKTCILLVGMHSFYRKKIEVPQNIKNSAII